MLRALLLPLVFEIISAYGTVGLSLGTPGVSTGRNRLDHGPLITIQWKQNYSLSGALRPLSKVVLCMVMIRGRHRGLYPNLLPPVIAHSQRRCHFSGLPVAIDRAVLLPHEYRESANESGDAMYPASRPTTTNLDEYRRTPAGIMERPSQGGPSRDANDGSPGSLTTKTGRGSPI